jgi:hypothetical protein
MQERKAKEEGEEWTRESDNLVDRSRVRLLHHLLQNPTIGGKAKRSRRSAPKAFKKPSRNHELCRNKRGQKKGTYGERIELYLGLVGHFAPLVLERVLEDEFWSILRAKVRVGLTWDVAKNEGKGGSSIFALTE